MQERYFTIKFSYSGITHGSHLHVKPYWLFRISCLCSFDILLKLGPVAIKSKVRKTGPTERSEIYVDRHAEFTCKSHCVHIFSVTLVIFY